jgi:hypothetical protein
LADIERGDSTTGESKEMIDRWVQVIDDWLRQIDRGMGGTAEGADPESVPDSGPEPVPQTPPAFSAG